MSTPPRKYYSIAEYLDIERDTDYKSEYHKGEIFTMAWAGHNQNRIVENHSIEIGGVFKEAVKDIFQRPTYSYF